MRYLKQMLVNIRPKHVADGNSVFQQDSAHYARNNPTDAA